MEVKIQKQIIDYFSFFEEFYNSSKTCLKDCQKSSISINKLITRCRNIEEAEVTNTPLTVFVELQNKLLESLHNQISEEVQNIESELSKLHELLYTLCRKYKNLINSCREINFEERTALVKGTAVQPPLKKLIEFADDTLTFGSQICDLVEISLKLLHTDEYKNSESLVDNFQFPANWMQRIPYIIDHTSLISENQI